MCFDLRATVEKDDEDNEQEISENGQEVLELHVLLAYSLSQKCLDHPLITSETVEL